MNRSHPDNPSINPPKMCPEYQSKWDKMMHFGCEMISSAWLPFGHNFDNAGLPRTIIRHRRSCGSENLTAPPRGRHSRMRMRMRGAAEHQILPKMRGVLQHTNDDVVS